MRSRIIRRWPDLTLPVCVSIYECVGQHLWKVWPL